MNHDRATNMLDLILVLQGWTVTPLIAQPAIAPQAQVSVRTSTTKEQHPREYGGAVGL